MTSSRSGISVGCTGCYPSEAVAAGQAESVSGWVNDALRLKADHDRRLRALDEFLASYEAEHGEISEEEMCAMSPVNIVGGSDCRFRPAPRTDRGLPDGTCRTDVRFAGTRPRA
jgi:hypothetical protein